MVFQDALTGLHPLRRVGEQIVEMIRVHAAPRQRGNREA